MDSSTASIVQRQDSSFRPYRHAIALSFILLAGAALRFAALGQESLWADEFHSLANATQPDWRAVCASAWNQGVQAPYFLVLHAFIRFAGQSDVALRLPSALFGTLSILAMYGWARLMFNRRPAPALLAAALLAVSPMHVWYSQEARPYAMQVLIELCALAALIRGFLAKENRRKRFAWLAASAALVILDLESHHFSIFIWGAFLILYALAFWPGRRISGLSACALMILMLGGAIHPMLGILDRLGPRSALQDFFPPSYSPLILIDVLRAQFLGPHGSPLPFWLQCTGIAIGTCLLIRGACRLIQFWCGAMPLGLIPVVGWLAALALPTAISLHHPIIFYGQRYLIIAIPFTTLLLAANGLEVEGPPRRASHILAALAFVILLLLQWSYYPPYYAYKQKHLWNQVGSVLDQQRRPGDAIFVIPERNAGLLARYMRPDANVHGLPMDPEAIKQTLLNQQGTIFIVGYNGLKELQPWLESQGVRRNLRVGIFETHQPGQILWINEYRKQ